MGKIVNWALATVCLSLATLIPFWYFVNVIATRIEECGMLRGLTTPLWQNFAFLVVVVIASIAIAMAFLFSKDGENHVLR